MKAKLIIAAAVLFSNAISLTSIATAQTPPVVIQDPTLQAVSYCLTDAISRGAAQKIGSSIQFFCTGTYAQTFFDLLGRYGYQSVTQNIPQNGQFIDRTFAIADGLEARCYQQTADASGRALSAFGCQLYMPLGTLLNR